MFDQAIIPAKLYFCHLSADYNESDIYNLINVPHWRLYIVFG